MEVQKIKAKNQCIRKEPRFSVGVIFMLAAGIVEAIIRWSVGRKLKEKRKKAYMYIYIYIYIRSNNICDLKNKIKIE